MKCAQHHLHAFHHHAFHYNIFSNICLPAIALDIKQDAGTSMHSYLFAAIRKNTLSCSFCDLAMQLLRTTSKVPIDLEEVRQVNRTKRAAEQLKLEHKKAEQAAKMQAATSAAGKRQRKLSAKMHCLQQDKKLKCLTSSRS